MKKFGVVGQHAKPSQAVQEIDGLAGVYDYIKDTYKTEVSYVYFLFLNFFSFYINSYNEYATNRVIYKSRFISFFGVCISQWISADATLDKNFNLSYGYTNYCFAKHFR